MKHTVSDVMIDGWIDVIHIIDAYYYAQIHEPPRESGRLKNICEKNHKPFGKLYQNGRQKSLPENIIHGEYG